MAYRALIIPDPRFTIDAIWPEESDYSPVGPRPGVPVDQGDVPSRMVLQATGDQASASELVVIAARAGHPDDDARFCYAPGTATTDWVGWDPPCMITGFEWILFKANGATDFAAQQPHVIRLQSGGLLAVARVEGTTPTSGMGDYAPGAFRMDGDTGVWTYLGEVFDLLDSDNIRMMSPCLLQLPSGRVLCFFWCPVSSTQVSVRMSFSDDDGETWACGSAFVLDTPVEDYTDTAYSRLRAAYSNGQVLLVGSPLDGGDGYYLIQWASDDDGCTFRTVWTQDHSSENHNYQEVLAAPGGGFDIYFVNSTGATDDVRHRRIATAYDSLDLVSADGVPIPNATDGYLAVWESEDGTRWLASVSESNSRNISVLVSTDGGVEWEECGTKTHAVSGGSGVVDGGIWIGEDDEVLLTAFAVAECRGRSYFITQIDQATSSHDANSLLCLELGGHSSVTHPCADEWPTRLGEGGPISWRITYAAIDFPGNFNDVPTWTVSSSGSATAAVSSDGLHLTTGADHIEYTADVGLLGNDIDDLLVALVELRVGSGGSVGSEDIAVRFRHADGTDDYELGLRLTTTGYRLTDKNAAGAAIGSDQVVDMDGTGGVQVLLLIDGHGGHVETAHREISHAGHPERLWTLGPSGTLTDDTTTPNASAALVWGQPSAGTAQSYWRLVCFARIPGEGGHWRPSTTQHRIDRLATRLLSSTPCRVPAGPAIAAVDGPAYRLDRWTIDTRYEYPIENLFPATSPSPRQPFITEQMGPPIIAWRTAPETDEESGQTATSIGVSLRNTNVRLFVLSGYRSGSWTPLATVLNGQGLLPYVRTGNTVTVDTGSTSPVGVPWITRDSIAYVVLDDGLGGSKFARTVISNSPGRWSEDDGARPTLVLDPSQVDGTEPASGLAWVVFADLTVLVHDLHDAYEGFRISIADQEYPASDNDRIRIGALVVGPVVAFGQEYGWGRVVETTPNVEVSERRSGTRTSRVLGPPRRSVSVSWAESPINQTDLWFATTTSPTVTIVATTDPDSEPIAVAADTAYVIHAVAGRGGASVPVVYLPLVPVETGDGGDPVARTISVPEASLYGRIVSPSARSETMVGDELESEWVRVSTLTIDEEV